jgi:hypothetical protein
MLFAPMMLGIVLCLVVALVASDLLGLGRRSGAPKLGL